MQKQNFHLTDPLAPYDFTGQVVLVTGGTRGIGRAISLAFARYGATVLAAYHSNQSAAEALEADAAKWPGTLHAVQLDVGDSRAVNRVVAQIQERHGAVTMLINNAGIFPYNAVVDIDDDEWDQVLQTNLTGAFYCARAVVPAMLEAQDGVIINISSVSGQRGSAYHAHYAATKGGMLAFSRSLARELSQHNIRVNAIAPGRIDTEMLETQAATGRKSDDKSDDYARWLSETPLHRLGTGEDIAAAVLFLASPAGAYIVGETLGVNGGIFTA